MFLGFVVKDIVPQYYTSNRTKEYVKWGKPNFQSPHDQDLIPENPWHPINQMGHGIEQAMVRFVRSTSVTLKALTAMIQMCFGECNCWAQRQCIWELAITKVRSNNGKVILCTLPLKAKTKKAKKRKRQEQKTAKTKTVSQQSCLEQHCLGLRAKEVRLLFKRKHRWLVQTSADVEK